MRSITAPNFILGGALVAGVACMAFTALIWTPYNPMVVNLRARTQAPSFQYWLGTDEFGRDVFSRLLYGASQSLSVALLTVLVAVIVGSLLGLMSGYVRGFTDRVLMVFSDAVLAFPGTLLALGLMVIMGPNRFGIILALGVAYTPSVLRIVRGTVLSAREREYVEASRVVGNSEIYTMLRHVLPNCVAPIVVLATSMFGWVVLAESGLSFLGLGVPPPSPTWGNMLSAARPHIESAPWLGIAPGLCISLTLLGINLLGDALRDRLDPRMER
ncbi:ABC transporter permease [Ensifer sp. 4252]|uniref:ABC transporter permease n=1 Tax=Ensifer sp. 4252 TaxID=3373915 RepID=UPI003D19580A